MAPIIFEDTVCIPTFLRTKYSYAVGKLFEGKIHEQLAAWILIDIIEDDFITEPNDVAPSNGDLFGENVIGDGEIDFASAVFGDFQAVEGHIEIVAQEGGHQLFPGHENEPRAKAHFPGQSVHEVDFKSQETARIGGIAVNVRRSAGGVGSPTDFPGGAGPFPGVGRPETDGQEGENKKRGEAHGGGTTVRNGF